MRIGVCSWSLRPESPSDLAAGLAKLADGGRDDWALQLALDPIREAESSGAGAWSLAETKRVLDDSGISIVSGMMAMEGEDYSTLESIAATGGVRVDELWERHRAASCENARIAAQLGLSLVTFHAGFLPHDPSDSVRQTMIGRVQEVAGHFAEHGVTVALETGQEEAATLVEVLNELDGVGVNFDPANMILYGMGDPVASLEQLAPWVKQLHAKDATPTNVAGTWGTEVPVGSGAVPWKEFLAVVRGSCPGCDMILEREAGENRVVEIRAGREHLDRVLADLAQGEGSVSA